MAGKNYVEALALNGDHTVEIVKSVRCKCPNARVRFFPKHRTLYHCAKCKEVFELSRTKFSTLKVAHG